jgi:hypothetical protein
MNRILLLRVIIFGTFMLNSCSDVKESSDYKKVVMDRDSLLESLTSREREIKDFLYEFERIELNLLAIDSNKASILKIHKTSFEGRKERIHALIADIYIAMDQNKSALKSLETKLSSEKKRRNEFANVLITIRKSMEEKEGEIQRMEKEIADLQVEVRNLKEAVAFKEGQLASRDTLLAQKEAKLKKQQELLNEKDKQLNRVYIIKGTTRELIKAGVIERKGGILGLGAVKIMGQKVPATNLQAVSKTEKFVKIGPYAFAKRKVISSHPDNSYFFVAKEGQLYINISYQDRFWSLSRYLVITLD